MIMSDVKTVDKLCQWYICHTFGHICLRSVKYMIKRSFNDIFCIVLGIFSLSISDRGLKQQVLFGNLVVISCQICKTSCNLL